MYYVLYGKVCKVGSPLQNTHLFLQKFAYVCCARVKYKYVNNQEKKKKIHSVIYITYIL